MRTFKDNNGLEWRVRLDVAAVKDVRAELGVNLMDLPEPGGELLGRLTGDPVLLVDVLYVICRSQADGRSIMDEQFGRGMSGDALRYAGEALLEEMMEFLPARVADEGDADGKGPPEARKEATEGGQCAGGQRTEGQYSGEEAYRQLWRWAGIAGVDPLPLTAAELYLAARARMESEWAQTAQLLCVLYNANRDTKRRPRPFRPEEFNPLAPRRRQGRVVTSENIGEMKQAFEGFGGKPANTGPRPGPSS